MTYCRTITLSNIKMSFSRNSTIQHFGTRQFWIRYKNVSPFLAYEAGHLLKCPDPSRLSCKPLAACDGAVVKLVLADYGSKMLFLHSEFLASCLEIFSHYFWKKWQGPLTFNYSETFSSERCSLAKLFRYYLLSFYRFDAVLVNFMTTHVAKKGRSQSYTHTFKHTCDHGWNENASCRNLCTANQVPLCVVLKQ
jgi:hypothetical protein